MLFGKRKLESARARIEAARTAVSSAEADGFDMTVARRLLKQAGALALARKFEESEAKAGDAKALAAAWREHGPAVRKWVPVIERARDELQAYGLEVPDLEADRERIKGLLDKGFVRVKEERMPAVRRVARLAERAASRYSGRVAAYEGAARNLASARAALEGAVSSWPHVRSEILRNGPWRPAFEALQRASDAFDGGKYKEARDYADWTTAACREVQEKFGGALGDLEVAEASHERLAAEGIPVEPMRDSQTRARAALERGDLAEFAASAQAARTATEGIREAHGHAVLSLKRAEEALGALTGWGFSSLSSQERVEEARRLLKAGDFAAAEAAAEAARGQAVSVRDRHRQTAERILAALQEARRFAKTDPDEVRKVEEVLAGAQRDLEEGRYAACQESLELGVFLVDELKRK